MTQSKIYKLFWIQFIYSIYQQPHNCLESKNMAAFVQKRGVATYLFPANVFTPELKEGNLQESWSVLFI